ncbi:MAG: alkaline phosphatase D family protein [Mariprofundaceae bacterium]|nr:alkaline phosphatase D family protein [Mariprofundaceae bacterium]
MIQIQACNVGPIVGHTEPHQVRLWGRATYQTLNRGKLKRAFGIVQLQKTGQPYLPPRLFKMNPNFDMTGIICWDKLEPNSHYTYQMGWFFDEREMPALQTNDAWDWDNADQGHFYTANPDATAARTFLFGSCRYLLKIFGGTWFDDRGDKTFKTMNQHLDQDHDIHQLLMVGDQIYADDLNFISPDQQVDEYLLRYQDAFRQPHIKALMARVSTYMTLDDHEIEDNWPNHASQKDMMRKYPAAMHAYQVYQASHSPLLTVDKHCKLKGNNDKFYYTFSDGCCDFFVTDSRTERNLQQQTMLSEVQIHALLDWLQDDSGKAKLVVTSVPFFPDTKKSGCDKWGAFTKQRDIIIQCIQENHIQKVVFLSGDVHCSMAAALDVSLPDEPALHIYSVISSAFYWPYPHMKRSQFNLTGHVASANNPKAYKLGQVSKVCSDDNFSKVHVTNSGISIEVYTRKGDLAHRIHYNF